MAVKFDITFDGSKQASSSLKNVATNNRLSLLMNSIVAQAELHLGLDFIVSIEYTLPHLHEHIPVPDWISSRLLQDLQE